MCVGVGVRGVCVWVCVCVWVMYVPLALGNLDSCCASRPPGNGQRSCRVRRGGGSTHEREWVNMISTSSLIIAVSVRPASALCLSRV